jgi:Protein of unknown function (DUF3039)
MNGMTGLGTDTIIDERTDQDTDTTDKTDPGKCAHIIVTKPGETATAVILEARIFGTPVTALCGHVFVPQRDPQKLPICPKCKEIYDLMRMMNENLNETPNS